MKIKKLLTIALLLMGVGHAFALDSGYYRLKSYNNKYLTENTSSHTLICSDLASTSYAQVWLLTVNGSNVTFRNVLTDRYIYWVNSDTQYYTDTNSRDFTMGVDNDVYTFHMGELEYTGLHCSNNNVVVYYNISEAKSKWALESVTVDEDALAAQRAAIVEASTSDLLKVFTTTACTELKSGYSESDLTALPSTTQALVAKLKNNTWTTYGGWDKTEKTFRIADYKAYSKHDRWSGIIGTGYNFSRLTNPTGISVSAGDYIQVYVGEIPSGQSVQLEVAGDYQSSGTTYSLKSGMNVLLMASSGNCFVQYEVDNTDDGKTPYTLINSYDPVTVHIEGGTVNGYFDLTQGDDNDDWAKLQNNLLSGSCVDIKTGNLLFHMQTDLVKAACPEKMVELLSEWDKILEMEKNLMGLEEFDGYWNNLLVAVDMSGQDYMHATTYGTYYDVSTISSVMSYADMFAGGTLWGPAHENGHIFQKYINMVGQTEVSNNLFSNVAVYNNGHLTSRASLISTTFENMANNVFWIDRGIWERTHMYFQLYQFFHILGKKTNFYPELYKALRSDPMVHTGGIFISATDDYLKFYKKCCEVSGYDLTEFFQAYGFFVIPTLTSYTLNNVTKDAYQVGDYATYYLTVTQEEIDAAKAEVAAMNLPKANIIFIEDRITAPDATYSGATAGTKKTAYDESCPIGQTGETGQYTTFDATCSDYKYNVTGKKVTVAGTGAVGFKLYDSEGNLRGLYNTRTFTLPDGIGTGYTIKAAAGNGTDVSATFDPTLGTIVSDVTVVPVATTAVTAGSQITKESDLVSGQLYLIYYKGNGNSAYMKDTGSAYTGYKDDNATQNAVYRFSDNGDGTWSIQNFVTGKYLGTPTANANTYIGSDTPGAWALNFQSNNNIAPSCNGHSLNRSGTNIHPWNTGTEYVNQLQIYAVSYNIESLPDFTDKDIVVSSAAAASLQTGKWYVMFDRGANHGYLYENNSNQLYNTNTVPAGSATDNAKYLVRIVGWENEYYIQTGLGNFFGNFVHSTVVPTTSSATEQITIKKIASTDGHFYLASALGVILDANTTYYGDATVVGYGTTVPTGINGNNDWAFYPVEFEEPWAPAMTEVYTINNTNTNRGALTYDPNASNKFVWSSGKGGATAFDATNPNCQWILVPTSTTNQYCLYNVGKQKFVVPTKSGGYNGYSWMFSSDAVALKLVPQSDGTYKVKTVDGDIYLSVSNNYTGPIINYNDAGAQFTISKQADASSEVTMQLYVALATIPAETKPVTLNAVGEKSYATLYLDYDTQTDADTKAYYVTETTPGYAQLTEVANDGRNIPAYTAVVLVNESAETNVYFSAGYSVSNGYTKAVDESDNLLKGTLASMELDLSENTNYYSLGQKNDKIGFYKFKSGTTTSIQLGANKAYLETTAASSPARGFVFDFDGGSTGIESMYDGQGTMDDGQGTMSDGQGTMYDLSGRRVNSLKRGIYIVNGRKTVVK